MFRDFQINRRMGTTDGRPLDLSLLLTASGDPGGLQPAEIFLDSIDIARIGFTTDAAMRQSLNSLAIQRREIINRAYLASSQLLGLQDPLSGPDYISAFTGTNAASGIKARWQSSEALSFTGGIAYLAPGGSVVDVDVDGDMLFAASGRYTKPLGTFWSLFGEIGVWESPELTASYSRSYMDGATLVSSQMQADGALIALYARRGVAYTPDTENQFLASARLARSTLNVSASSEDKAADNLFAAHVSGRAITADTADLMAMWTRVWSPEFDSSLFASLGQEFANADAVHADIDWVGKARGGWQARYFGTIGARLGWNFRENWILDATGGVVLREDDDTDWNAGVELKAKF